jgi:hypothetical protein
MPVPAASASFSVLRPSVQLIRSVKTGFGGALLGPALTHSFKPISQRLYAYSCASAIVHQREEGVRISGLDIKGASGFNGTVFTATLLHTLSDTLLASGLATARMIRPA